MTRTRIVRWLRVLLPLLALALLSTMFLFSRMSDSESRIPYTEVDAEAAARDGRLVAPEYSTVAGDGARIGLRAAQGRVADAGGDAQGLELDWQRPDGVSARATAPEGGSDADGVRLNGGVVIETSTGWRMQTDSLTAASDRGMIAARNPVEAEAPFGQLSAGSMQLGSGETGKPDGSAVLNFSGGVRLIYRPEAE